MPEEERKDPPDVKNDSPPVDNQNPSEDQEQAPASPPVKQGEQEQGEQAPATPPEGQEEQEPARVPARNPPPDVTPYRRTSLAERREAMQEQWQSMASQALAAVPQRGGINYITMSQDEEGNPRFESVFVDPVRGRMVSRPLSKQFSFKRFAMQNRGRIVLNPRFSYNPQTGGFAEKAPQEVGSDEEEPQGPAGNAAPPGEQAPPSEPPNAPPGEGAPPKPGDSGSQDSKWGGSNDRGPLLVKISPGTKIVVAEDGKTLVFE